MKIARTLAAVVIIAGLSPFLGCYSVKISNLGGRQMCVVENSCLKALGFIPVGSGDIDSKYENDWVCFEDTTTIRNNVRLVERAMAKNHASNVRNVTSYRADEQVILFLLKRSTLHTSVELISNPVQ